MIKRTDHTPSFFVFRESRGPSLPGVEKIYVRSLLAVSGNVFLTAENKKRNHTSFTTYYNLQNLF